MSELHEIKLKLIALQTSHDEKWKAHDKRSEENWNAIKESQDIYFQRLDTLTENFNKFCLATPNRKEVCMKEAKDFTKLIVSLVIGIPTTVTAIIAVIIMIHKLITG